MKRYAMYYAIWLAGVLSFAAVAYGYYRRIQAMGEDAVVSELDARRPDRFRTPTPDPED
jgi:hypothetical protein